MQNTMAYRVVAAARGWIGTRFQHQGRQKKTERHKGGCDCLGLLVGVAQELQLHNVRRPGNMPLAEYDENSYGHYPDEQHLQESLKNLLPDVKGKPRMGDVLLLRVDGAARHLAIVSDYEGTELGMIHAYAPARAVVEHRLDAEWRSRIVKIFRLGG